MQQFKSPLVNGHTFTDFNRTVGNIHTTAKINNPTGKAIKNLKSKLHPKSKVLSVPIGW